MLHNATHGVNGVLVLLVGSALTGRKSYRTQADPTAQATLPPVPSYVDAVAHT